MLRIPFRFGLEHQLACCDVEGFAFVGVRGNVLCYGTELLNSHFAKKARRGNASDGGVRADK